MSGNSLEILVVCGDHSGDARAAEVVGALRSARPDIKVFAMGGASLRAAGAELLEEIETAAVFGPSEALRHIFRFRRIMRRLEAFWLARRPAAVLLVDFGGFNLRLARRLKAHGARIAYYVSPQVWASRPGRVRWVRRYVDLMMVLFRFEADFFRERGVAAVHVGHPLLDELKVGEGGEEFRRRHGFEPAERLIGFMPGSRQGEVTRLLPVFLEAAEILRERGFRRHMIIAAPSRAEQIRAMMAPSQGALVIVERRYDAMAACDLLVLASGTAALESGLLGVPAVVAYKASWLTGLAARLLMRVKHVSLPNIILGREILPELLQRRCRAESIALEVSNILEDPERYVRIRRALRELASHMGEPGAARRAARNLLDSIGEK